MEKEWGKDVQRADSPRLASYAALRCGILYGILYERGYVEWFRCVVERLKENRPVMAPSPYPSRDVVPRSG